MMISHADVGYAQKGERDYRNVSPVPLESHDPLKRWLRAKLRKGKNQLAFIFFSISSKSS